MVDSRMHDAGTLIDLGPLYYVFMVMLMVFSTNAINILAGVNGLEVGQSIVIGLSIVLNNFIQLIRLNGNPEDRRWNHLFSIYILLPFLGCSVRVWWPYYVSSDHD